MDINIITDESKIIGMLRQYPNQGGFNLNKKTPFYSVDEIIDYIDNDKNLDAHIGQIIAVSKHDNSDDYILYMVKSNKYMYQLSRNLIFNSYEDAILYFNSHEYIEGLIVTIIDDDKYRLYAVSNNQLKRLVADTDRLIIISETEPSNVITGGIWLKPFQ